MVSQGDMVTSDIELGTVHHAVDTGDDSSDTLVELPLPTPPRPSESPQLAEQPLGVHPADHGLHAWLFLAGCFVLEGLVWGFAFSFGVFQTYYTTAPPFSSHPKGVAAIGTTALGVMYLWAPISLLILEMFPRFRKLVSAIGLALIFFALLLSAFATQVWQLIITQGVLYGIGGSFLYSPTMFYLDEWFIERKGLAFGIMWAGVGTSGLIFPYVLTALLKHVGHMYTMILWSLLMLIICTPLLWFIKPRLPIPIPKGHTTRVIDLTFMFRRTYLFLQVSNIIEALGFFIPAIYIQKYALEMGYNTNWSTVFLALLNVSSVGGSILLGWFCDRMDVVGVVLISTGGTVLSVIALWGFAGWDGRGIVFFTIFYGIFAGGYSAIWAGMMKDILAKHPEAGIGTMMGLLAAGRGVGSLVSGPLSEVLLKAGKESSGYLKAYWGNHCFLILFTAVTALFGGFAAFGLRACGGRKDEE